MIGYFILIALCALGTNAVPKPVIKHDPLQGRVGGATEPAIDCPHAAMVLVHRANLDGTNTAALGGGSIISARHVLTAAHLVQGDVNRYQIGFIVGTARRLVEATFRLIHEAYDNTDFNNDIALIFLQGTATFPLASAIVLTNTVDPPTTGGTYSLVGFGFTAANSTQASSDPFEAIQGVEAACTFPAFEPAESHFCATDGAGTTFVCPGDNGAGLFVRGATVPENRLFGVASRILTGCATAQSTGYTFVGKYVDWITNVTGIPAPTLMASTNRVRLHQL